VEKRTWNAGVGKREGGRHGEAGGQVRRMSREQMRRLAEEARRVGDFWIVSCAESALLGSKEGWDIAEAFWIELTNEETT
jgi:hypothetical protein